MDEKPVDVIVDFEVIAGNEKQRFLLELSREVTENYQTDWKAAGVLLLVRGCLIHIKKEQIFYKKLQRLLQTLLFVAVNFISKIG